MAWAAGQALAIRPCWDGRLMGTWIAEGLGFLVCIYTFPFDAPLLSVICLLPPRFMVFLAGL